MNLDVFSGQQFFSRLFPLFLFCQTQKIMKAVEWEEQSVLKAQKRLGRPRHL